MDREALATLLARAEETHSDALVVRHRERVVGEWHFGRAPGPIETMSCTKSVVNLAIGALIDDGALAGLDQPVHEIYPEWRQGDKRRITLRHLLNHTSGLQNYPDTSIEIYPAPDVVRLALAAELSDPPGSWLAYNNKAVNLLAGIVERVGGQRLDHYLRDRVFRPLGIAEFEWTLDGAGNPYAMAGLQLGAGDLAKIGQLLLNRGRWDGTQIVSAGWIEASCRQSQPYNPSWGPITACRSST